MLRTDELPSLVMEQVSPPPPTPTPPEAAAAAYMICDLRFKFSRSLVDLSAGGGGGGRGGRYRADIWPEGEMLVLGAGTGDLLGDTAAAGVGCCRDDLEDD